MVAIVTGGTRGIGNAILKKLVEEGIKVAFTYKDSTLIAEELKNTYGDQILGIRGNGDAVEKTLEKWGQIDILVNNAGISYTSLLQDTPEDVICDLIRTNLTDPILLIRKAIPALLRSPQPVIINMSSIWGEKGASCESVYAASKGGLNQLTTSLARELGPCGIRVVGIAPGLIGTEMTTCLDRETLDYCTREIPLKKIGTPKEVADLTCYLIQNTYLNGVTITIDGGYSL